MDVLKSYNWSTLVLLVVLVQISFGSQDSNGPNGVDSDGLGLTGDGIALGQVEVNRPAVAGETGANPPWYRAAYLSGTCSRDRM